MFTLTTSCVRLRNGVRGCNATTGHAQGCPSLAVVTFAGGAVYAATGVAVCPHCRTPLNAVIVNVPPATPGFESAELGWNGTRVKTSPG